jgi:XRE family transcriptional regulator, aerobic/anaerobic benzoate catabolism transcriptional regulator
MSDLRAILEARAPLYNRAEASVDTAGETAGYSLTKLTETARALIA